MTAIVPSPPVLAGPSTSARWISFDREAPVVTGFADAGGATAALVAAVLVWAGHARLAALALVASLVAL